MADVFISFIHEEVEWAQSVQLFITTVLNYKSMPFMSSDKFQIYAGEKWLDRIMEELEGAKVVLLMLSKKSVERPWVNFEAGAAWTRNIVTIPICFQGMRKGELPKPYSSLQAVDLDSRDDHEYLARSVAHHLDLQKPFTRGLRGMFKDKASEELAERQERAYQELDVDLRRLGVSKR